ncbi:MAG TPA: PEGA domain-containing protein [Caulobacteraceae bacterium]|jgi:hypothetical protein|nr:PEGA domain-containing protein [Caulobacteraceae bacterium]
MQIDLRRAARAGLLACALGSLGACATVTRGVNTNWAVESTPPGAKVQTTNGYSCEHTPCTFHMLRKSDFDVTVSMAGYKPWKGHVNHSVHGGGAAGVVGNAVVGGVIGIGVDVASGAAFDLRPNPLKVTLDKAEVAEAPATPAPAGSP